METKNPETENKITHQLTFADEEEGVLSLSEGELECFRARVYPMGDGEAEVSAQDVGILSEIQKYDIIPEFVIRKVIKCIIVTIGALKENGITEPVFLTEKATKFEEILGSTTVVQKRYSEFMMYLPPEQVETTRNCGRREELIRYEQTEEGYICRNEDRSFFAKVSPYRDGWYVYEVEVRYDRRRTGIATACMGVLAERFLQMYLQVGSYNEPAVRLYEKLGFQVIEELCYYGEA